MTTGTREEIKVGQLAIRFLVEGSASGGSVAMFELDVPVGARVPVAHSHDAYEETIYGIAGVLTFTVEGRPHEVGPGDALCIPRGAVHRFENLHSADSRTLAIVTPGILSPDYFRELSALVKASVGGPPDPAKIGEIMLRHGLTPAPS
jgi:quercetin dioxygenase-like cupin family protein